MTHGREGPPPGRSMADLSGQWAPIQAIGPSTRLHWALRTELNPTPNRKSSWAKGGRGDRWSIHTDRTSQCPLYRGWGRFGGSRHHSLGCSGLGIHRLVEGEENGEGEFLREELSERVLGIYPPSFNCSLSF